jgi:hypothetical protein
MTAKKLFKELQEILTKSKGRDYPLVVWTGLGADESDEIAFVRLIDDEDEPENDEIILYTHGASEDLGHFRAGLNLHGKPELN